MRPRILQALTWATVAAAVLSALWLAWAEGGSRNDGLPLNMAQRARVQHEWLRGNGRVPLQPQEPRSVHRSSSQ